MNMIRPKWKDFVEDVAGNYVACSCGQILQNFDQLRDHWQAGHFDYLEEVEDNNDSNGANL